MPAQRLIALNGNAGAFVDILATVPVSRIVMKEDEATAPTGIQVKVLLDNFATTNVYAFASEPVVIPDIGANWDHFRKGLGYPVNFIPTRAADKLVSVRSNAVGATTLRFTEYE